MKTLTVQQAVDALDEAFRVTRPRTSNDYAVEAAFHRILSARTGICVLPTEVHGWKTESINHNHSSGQFL